PLGSHCERVPVEGFFVRTSQLLPHTLAHCDHFRAGESKSGQLLSSLARVTELAWWTNSWGHISRGMYSVALWFASSARRTGRTGLWGGGCPRRISKGRVCAGNV